MAAVYWMALRSVPGLGIGAARRLIARFGSLEAAHAATPADLRLLRRISQDGLRRWQETDLSALEADVVRMAEDEMCVVTPDEPDYPADLAEAPQAPLVLYIRGRLTQADAQRVTIVGTREPSATGFAVARLLALTLAARGFTIVSGLAVGIDTAAHAGALAAPAGRTIAVLGSGLASIHPTRNRAMAQEIAERGALLTEYPPSQAVDAGRLLARDRILAALGGAVVVVEARAKSGSIVTAGHAARLGRPVFAIPGTPGCDALLDQGALPIGADQEACDAIATAAERRSAPPRARREAPSLFA